jgi:signal transduction histidine kinase
MAERLAVRMSFYYAPLQVWFECHTYPTPEGLVIYFNDISERKRAEAAIDKAQRELKNYAAELEMKVVERTAELERALSELEAFSYSVSHDLRAPLRAIQGYAELVMEEYGSAEGKEMLGRISASAKRLDRLALDVLSYTRIGRGQLMLQRIELDKILPQVMQDYPNLHDSRDYITIVPPLLPVLGNETFLIQCISNLLVNAVKFVQAGAKPQVKIWTERREDFVRMWVEDKGIGISAHDQERLFTMFSRLQHQSSYEGSGIGLAIVHRAAERMGGKVGVESEEGKGSRFWLDLKAAD